MKINVYIGCIGSGKDYRAKQDCDIQLAFADQLREDVWKMIGWKPKTQEEYEAFKNAVFSASPDALSFGVGPIFTGRNILERYGSLMKETHGENYWSNILIKKLELLTYPNNYVIGISDCRFLVESNNLIKFAKRVNKLGHDIQLEFIHTDFKSDKYNATSEHESEKLAQQFAGKVFAEGEFNKLIFEMYG